MAGQTIREIGRRGKFLTFRLDDYVLVSHLRMEGRYGLYAASDPVEPHTHVIFSFTDGTEMRYKDVRQFGTMHLFPLGEEETRPPLSKLGLEPVDPSFTLEAFKQALAGKTTKIKPLLLNQAYITGLGLYSLFVDDTLPLPRWLKNNDFDDLKNHLVSVIVAVLAVLFLREAVSRAADVDLLSFAVALAVIIAALTFFLIVKGAGKH